jgi:hypothetical protein
MALERTRAHYGYKKLKDNMALERPNVYGTHGSNGSKNGSKVPVLNSCFGTLEPWFYVA